MINDQMQVTFGIEFESVFAFHQSLLRKRLENIRDNPAIIQDITEDHRIALGTGGLHDMKSRPYMGWALTSEAAF